MIFIPYFIALLPYLSILSFPSNSKDAETFSGIKAFDDGFLTSIIQGIYLKLLF